MKRSILSLLRRAPRRPLTGLAASLLCLAALSACVGEDGVPRDNTAMLPEDQRVSSVPWNKPQPGENTGSQLGALANDPRIGGGGTAGASAGSAFAN